MRHASADLGGKTWKASPTLGISDHQEARVLDSDEAPPGGHCVWLRGGVYFAGKLANLESFTHRSGSFPLAAVSRKTTRTSF